MKLSLTLAALTLPLAACNQNTAIGNDREAELAPEPLAAPVEDAASALQNVATAIIKPETMSEADIRALGGKNGRCEVILTEVAFPSFIYEPGGKGTIKLNGKLIPLQAAGKSSFASGDLSVRLNLLDEEGNAGSQGMEMIVVPPGAKDEIGYHGYVRCH
ncbi:hypothetical protein FHS61_002008 [Altererythrobacter atlanticus]|uniref:Uncharacterized protein n=1 Tax=Croceibacterium atlanticum TaxID=1267766 RepID=A0A0F7KRZ7_9SPHN|nr:DUF6692 family protein [Croceibacterium atlanticum]AKH41520.1 hypothetical protein WYH_00461 [Croceibacterium atlanticum]MBB5732982.1 hypothetical protein [Croceibacterium atlanticum]